MPTPHPMAVVFLVPNQAWVVVFNGNPISIYDRTFWSDRADLVKALDLLGLDVDAKGVVHRWCVVGRQVESYPYQHEPLCPNHANQASPFCDRHQASYGEMSA